MLFILRQDIIVPIKPMKKMSPLLPLPKNSRNTAYSDKRIAIASITERDTIAILDIDKIYPITEEQLEKAYGKRKMLLNG